MRSRLAVVLALVVAVPCLFTAQTASTSPKVWVGQQAEYEDCLKTAPVASRTDVPIGVTRPVRLFFEPGAACASAAFSSQPTSRNSGFLESHQSRIAAYELDKLLQLEMVPPTVERVAEGKLGAAQLWIEGAVYLSDLDDERPPNGFTWLRQIRRWRVFDNLIAEIDRNDGNVLVLRDPNWHLVLIDHSRAFSNTTRLVQTMQFIDRPFFARLKALDDKTLEATVSPLLLDGSRSLLRRRDAIVEHFEKLAEDKGEAAVFTP